MSVNVPTPENGGNVNRPFTYASMLVLSPNVRALMTRFEPRNTWSPDAEICVVPVIFRSTCSPVARLVTVAFRAGEVTIVVPPGSASIPCLPWISILTSNDGHMLEVEGRRTGDKDRGIGWTGR